MSATSLNEEINAVLDRLADEGAEWRAAWIAQEICEQHAEGLAGNDDAEFWRHGGNSECRREVTRCINRRAGDKAQPRGGAQVTLPGFEHMHAYYVVQRQGADVGVSVYDLTDGELAAKEAAYRSMGRACFAHADELDQFRARRGETA